MSWAVIRDDAGRAVRMEWLGTTARLKPFPVQTPGGTPVCPGCGYCGGWHTAACTMRNEPQESRTTSNPEG